MQRHVKQSEGGELDGQPSEPFVEPAEEVATPVERPTTRTGKRRASAWLTALVVLAAAALLVVDRAPIEKTGSTPDKAASTPAKLHEPLPVPVTVGAASTADVPIYLDGLGTVQAFNSVTVRVRVDGELTKVAFTEGQDVHAGDLLAQIDPDPFRAQLEQAEAKKAQDEAQLANARIELERDFSASNAIARQVIDTQQALVNQNAAQVKADQAAIDSANVQLRYTRINSPIDGRTGVRLVDQGNIVHASDANGLVVVTQMKPISVVFTLPEQTIQSIRKDNRTVLATGKLAVIDNQIDTTTGTIRLKATFPNDDLRLWPGQFVNARLLLTTRKDGLVVPASVVQRGPEGPYAFVIKDGQTVAVQPVKVAQIENGEALIDEGLQAGQEVVVDGQYRLQPGSKVKLAQSGKASVAE
jgi:multidrug efflux system membrane fusion protein